MGLKRTCVKFKKGSHGKYRCASFKKASMVGKSPKCAGYPKTRKGKLRSQWAIRPHTHCVTKSKTKSKRK